MTDETHPAVEKTRMPVPGARERNTLTARKPGSGGFATRLTAIPTVGSSMDATTIAARQREGGGAPDQRRTAASDKDDLSRMDDDKG